MKYEINMGRPVLDPVGKPVPRIVRQGNDLVRVGDLNLGEEIGSFFLSKVDKEGYRKSYILGTQLYRGETIIADKADFDLMYRTIEQSEMSNSLKCQALDVLDAAKEAARIEAAQSVPTKEKIE